MALQSVNNPELARAMDTVLHDFNQIRKSNAETIAFTEVEAEKLEAAERAKAAGAAKPVL